ncbi:MAG: GNAT family N-acetyltransferase [Propionicimonas sp.]|uniref:GNAT family N-acetyltransferase n=1 Tax=Propionicimonas sp. TaxID=1955623 RepID=UPI002B221245|nr:GNAT family N-acetyltransferase [Propionicimonas sp.]MEA4943249.1 GNAT family N-acetyltransferase [Propionicimonas sp.]
MIISTARAEDLDEVLALEATGFEPGERWSRESWASEIDHPERLVLVRHDAHGLIVAVASFSLAADASDLLRVIVHPAVRSRGYGSSLVRAGMEWAKAVGAERMLLEVRPDNAPAVKVYTRLGFKPLSTRRNYYPTGADALVMAVML